MSNKNMDLNQNKWKKSCLWSRDVPGFSGFLHVSQTSCLYLPKHREMHLTSPAALRPPHLILLGRSHAKKFKPRKGWAFTNPLWALRATPSDSRNTSRNEEVNSTRCENPWGFSTPPRASLRTAAGQPHRNKQSAV